MDRESLDRLLKPASSLISEKTWLSMLGWCFHHCLPLCRVILVFYRSAYDFQLSPAEITLVLSHLRRARSFLVFGVGRDTPIWVNLGPDKTCFLEHDQQWIELQPEKDACVYPIDYSTQLDQHLSLLDLPEALQLNLPDEVSGRDWDLILVDAPPGCKPGTPGRMQSIYAASKLIRPGGLIFVHDMDREVEQIYSRNFLGPLLELEGRMGMFRANWETAPPLTNNAETSQTKSHIEISDPEIDPSRIVPYYKDTDVEVNIVNLDTNMRVKPRHDREVLLVRDPWYPDSMIDYTIGYRRSNRAYANQVYYLSNTREIHRLRKWTGFNSHYINLGCLIDEQVFQPPAKKTRKLYDAVMISRFSWYENDQLKRHFLAGGIEKLALIDPLFGTTSTYYRNHYFQKPNCYFSNTTRLEPGEVTEILGQSHCGLILSAHEGVCRASSEYLLSGLPVVSTPSAGGRDVWYDDYNSIIVEPCSTAVAEAVKKLKHEARDPWRIRADYLQKAEVFRRRFVSDVLTPIFERFGVKNDPQKVFDTHPFRWWLEK